MTWTRFMDMNSGGGQKEEWKYIYIEAAEIMAVTIFYNRFGHNPSRVTCTCCGADYSITEEESLGLLTFSERGADYEDPSKPESGKYKSGNPFVPLDEYMNEGKACFIASGSVEESEKVGNIPVQGYVWLGG